MLARKFTGYPSVEIYLAFSPDKGDVFGVDNQGGKVTFLSQISRIYNNKACSVFHALYFSATTLFFPFIGNYNIQLTLKARLE